MHLTLKSVRRRHRDEACASRVGSGRASATTTAAAAAVADDAAHKQESNDSSSSPDQDVRHSAPRFSFAVRNSLAPQPRGRIRLSSQHRTVCTITLSLSVVVTTESEIFCSPSRRHMSCHVSPKLHSFSPSPLYGPNHCRFHLSFSLFYKTTKMTQTISTRAFCAESEKRLLPTPVPRRAFQLYAVVFSSRLILRKTALLSSSSLRMLGL